MAKKIKKATEAVEEAIKLCKALIELSKVIWQLIFNIGSITAILAYVLSRFC